MQEKHPSSFFVPLGKQDVFTYFFAAEPPTQRLVFVNETPFFIWVPWMCYTITSLPVVTDALLDEDQMDRLRIQLVWATLSPPTPSTACYKALFPNIAYKMSYVCSPFAQVPSDSSASEKIAVILGDWWSSSFGKDLSRTLRNIKEFQPAIEFEDHFKNWESCSEQQVRAITKNRPLQCHISHLLPIDSSLEDRISLEPK